VGAEPTLVADERFDLCEIVADGGTEQDVRQAGLPEIVQMADADLEVIGKLPFRKPRLRGS